MRDRPPAPDSLYANNHLVPSPYDNNYSELVLVITYPPITTTLIPVYNINITATSVNGIDYTITPSIFPSQTITIGPPPGVDETAMTLVVTSTPTGSTTWPPLSDKDLHSKVRHSSAGPPAPICAGSGCGVGCTAMCNSCGLLGCGGCIFDCGTCLSPFGCGGIDITGGGCVGPACPAAVCVGGGCEPDAECEKPKTASACTASCSVTLPSAGARTFTTECYTTRCTERTACNAVATTTTTRTTSGCPTLSAYQPWWTDDNQAVFAPGEDGWGGFLAATGTYLDPALNTIPIDYESGTDDEDGDGGGGDPTPTPEPEPEPKTTPASGREGYGGVFFMVYWEVGGKGQYRGYSLWSKTLSINNPDICTWEKDPLTLTWKDYPGDPIMPPV
ncbi:hypothetical protein ACHAPS_002255 [Verticillium nonalfalfae]